MAFRLRYNLVTGAWDRISHIAYRISHIAYRISHIAYRLSLIAYRLSCIAYRVSLKQSVIGALLPLRGAKGELRVLGEQFRRQIQPPFPFSPQDWLVGKEKGCPVNSDRFVITYREPLDKRLKRRWSSLQKQIAENAESAEIFIKVVLCVLCGLRDFVAESRWQKYAL